MSAWWFIILVPAWVLWLWLGKRKVRPHRTAILTVAIPLTLLAIATIVLVLLDGPEIIVDNCWLIAFYGAAAAIVLSVVFALMRKWEIAKGIGFGSGISLVVCLIVFVVADFL